MFPWFKTERAVAPVQHIRTGAEIGRVAILGVDVPGLRPKMLCEQGSEVLQGQPVFHDRSHPDVVFAAPVSGTVESITYGPRRILSALVIRLARHAASPKPASVDAGTAADLRAALLASGLWPSFLTRPFGRIPTPDAVADAIFVTATGDNAHAPDAGVVLEGREDAFGRGIKALTLLTEGPVFLCQPPGKDLVSGLEDRIRIAQFASGPLTGLAGHHIHRLHPVRAGRMVWTVGYQDVATIGEWLETGVVNPTRLISLVGPQASSPRLIRTLAGASLTELIAGETRSGNAEPDVAVVSGSPVSGRPAAWLGRYHQQVTLCKAAPARRASPNRGLKAWLSPSQQSPAALIPTAALERALGFGVPVVPLMRALSVGDSDAARKLGCLEMTEEDLAALSMVSTSGADYGQMLRHVLDELAEDA